MRWRGLAATFAPVRHDSTHIQPISITTLPSEQIQTPSNLSTDSKTPQSKGQSITPTRVPEENNNTKSVNVFSRIRSRIMEKLESLDGPMVLQNILLIALYRLSPSLSSRSTTLCRSAQHGYPTRRIVGSLRVATMRRRNAGCTKSETIMCRRIREPTILAGLGSTR